MKKTLLAIALIGAPFVGNAGFKVVETWQEDKPPPTNTYGPYGIPQGPPQEEQCGLSVYGVSINPCAEGYPIITWGDGNSRNDIVSASVTIEPEPGELGRPVHLFVAAANASQSGAAVLTPDGWIQYGPGVPEPIAVIESFPSSWSIDLIVKQYVCTVVQQYGGGDIYVGYGVLQPGDEATIASLSSSGATSVTYNSLKATYMFSDMLARKNYTPVMHMTNEACNAIRVLDHDHHAHGIFRH